MNVIGMAKMTPPIKDLLPRLTPILKNRLEKQVFFSNHVATLYHVPLCECVCLCVCVALLFKCVSNCLLITFSHPSNVQTHMSYTCI